MHVRSALLGLCLWGALHPCSAHGQDDWSLERRPARVPTVQPRSAPPPETRAHRLQVFLADPSSDHALEALVQLGALPELVSQVRTQSEARPSDLRLRRALARLLIASGADVEGLGLLAEAGREGELLRAHALTALGRHGEAAAQWRALADTSPGRAAQASALREAARAQLAAGEPDAALATLHDARVRGGAAFALELGALEREAQRAGGHLRELADALSKRGAYREAASVREELGDGPAAIEAYRARLRQADDRAARAALVRLYAAAGELDAARREAAVLVRRAPAAPDDLVRWAELERAAGAGQGALTRLLGEQRARPRDVALLRALRTLYASWGEQARAERALQDLVRLEPHEPEHRLALADGALARGDRDDALRLLQGLGGATPAAEANLARVLGERDLLPEAVAQIERAVQRAPEVLEYRRLRASLLERAGRGQDAERAWRELLAAREPEARSEARDHLASAWRRAGTARLHATELEEQLRAGFDADTARLLLALYAREPDQRVRRTQLLEQLLASAPDDATALALRERDQLERGELSAALDTRLHALAGGSPAVARGALELAMQHPQLANVPTLIERALAVAPRDADLQRMAGDVFARRGDAAAARVAYERALVLDPQQLAARNALAEDAARASDGPRLEALLRPTIESAPDGPVLAAAVQLLLQHDGERAERLLLAALTGPGRATKLRLLMQVYARKQPGERAAVERALPALLLALVSGSVAEQRVALTLLTAVPVARALAPLLALAERADVGTRERALALLAVAALHDAQAAARLRTLYDVAGRALRPFALWALHHSAPHALPLAAQTASDPALRGLSALLDASAARALEHDPEPAVRAAALWTLSRAESGRHDAAQQALLGDRLRLALVMGGPGSSWVIPALFADAATRGLAGQVLTQEPGPFALPTPSWPFVLDGYLDQVAQVSLQQPRAPAFVARWPDIERMALALLSPESLALQSAASESRRSATFPPKTPATLASVRATLQALTAQNGGLVPVALRDAGACVPPELARSLGSALAPALAAQLTGPLRAVAQDLLVRAGGLNRPELLAALDQGSLEDRRALVELLAGAPALPSSLREKLADLLTHAADWPTRMWAARALSVADAQLVQEPLALVRAQAARGPVHTEDACATPRGVSN